MPRPGERTERADDWLTGDPLVENREVDELPVTILWEGEPSVATAAVVMTSDGEAFVAAYILTPDNPALLLEMVESVLLTHSTPADDE